MVQQFAWRGLKRVVAFADSSDDRFAAEYSIWITGRGMAGGGGPGFHACSGEYNHFGGRISIGFISCHRHRFHRYAAQSPYIDPVAGAVGQVGMKAAKALFVFVVMAVSILFNARPAKA